MSLSTKISLNEIVNIILDKLKNNFYPFKELQATNLTSTILQPVHVYAFEINPFSKGLII